MIENEEIIRLLKESKPVYEPTNLDFKKAEEISSSLLETISAFSNTDGGDIILGIHQKKDEPLKFFGIQAAEDQETKLRNLARNEMNLTETDFQLSTENLPKYDLPIMKIHIKKINELIRRPIFIKSRGIESGTFIRIGQRDEKMPKYMLEDIRKQQMILDHRLPPPELRVENNSKLDDFDFSLIKQYAEKLNIGVDRDTKPKEYLNFLESKNIIQNLHPTRFGLLCFSFNPEKYLGNKAVIQVSDESGIDILAGDRGKNKNIFEGDLLKIIALSMDWIAKNISTKRIVMEDGSQIEKPIIPAQILREIVVNAICHRDYDTDQKIFIKIDKDKISIENPGLLNYKMYTYNFIFPGKTEHPNPNIAKYLFRNTSAEGEGKGFSLLLKSCLAGEIDIPTLAVDFSGRVLITVSNKTLVNKEIEIWLETKKYLIVPNLNENDKKILAYLYKAHDLINSGYFVINLSEEFLDYQKKNSLIKLISEKLVVSKNIGSTKIFKLSDDLLRQDFSSELHELFGSDFLTLDAQSKQILSFAMQFSKINTEFSARKLTRLLYPNTPEEKLSEDIARRIRGKCNWLLSENFLKRNDTIPISSPKGNLKINLDYKQEKEKEELMKKQNESEKKQDKLF
ncbi:MAG: RNA-binding domain-containing protein [Candidatus Paceibacterota bacterium]